MRTLTSCNGTYVRDAQGVWQYPWDQPVPGASDLTLSDLMVIDAAVGCADALESFRPLSAAERRWLAGESAAIDDVLVRQRPGRQPNAGDLIVGLAAPELHALTMFTVRDVARVTGVSKSTIDSYRYRGYLPDPQILRGRTPLWARPIIHHWLISRRGSGWRSDVYEQPAADAAPDLAVQRSATVTSPNPAA